MNTSTWNTAFLWMLAPAFLFAAWALAKLGQYLHTKNSSTVAGRELSLAVDKASVVVHDLEATWVPTLRAAAANGKLTGEDVTKLRVEALSRLKLFIGAEGLDLLMRAVRIAVPAVDPFLSGLLETQVAKLGAGPEVVVGMPAERLAFALNAAGPK